jgi:hypothetical protein
MNPDSQNFDSLRQLLALKRHEVPPPGYFDRFNRDVMARIKAGDTGDELGAGLSWFRRLLGVFDVKPVFAGAFGTAVCAFLISGVIGSENNPVMATAAPTVGDSTIADAGMSAPGLPYATSSNAVASGSLFDQLSLHATVVPVNDRLYFAPGN